MPRIRRGVLVVACSVLTLTAVIVAGFTIGRECMEWDGYATPREIQITFRDGEGTVVPGVTVEREVVTAGFAGPPGPWEFQGADSDQTGVLLFAIGGTGASGGSCSYFWGLRKTSRRDDSTFGYFFMLDGRPIAWYSGEDLALEPVGSLTPLPESLFASLEHPESFGIEAGVERVLLVVTVDGR